VATEVRKCSTCGNGFLGTPRAQYCSSACKQQAHRRRTGGKRNADRNEAAVTVLPAEGVHTSEAVAVLAELDADLAANAEESGESVDWSAADWVVREAIASAIDRKVWLSEAYSAAADVMLRLKLSTELRLTEQAIARLLRQIKTELPEPMSRTSQKAQRAANMRWGNKDGA
jgi:hypothetical protein